MRYAILVLALAGCTTLPTEPAQDNWGRHLNLLFEDVPVVCFPLDEQLPDAAEHEVSAMCEVLEKRDFAPCIIDEAARRWRCPYFVPGALWDEKMQDQRI